MWLLSSDGHWITTETNVNREKLNNRFKWPKVWKNVDLLEIRLKLSRICLPHATSLA